MKIGVSGASGQLGKSVLKELSNKKPEIVLVGISRTPEAISSQTLGKYGDYNKPSSLVTAYHELDALLIIPSVDLRPGVRSAQNIAAINAAVEANVKHIVFLSVVGTKKEDEPGMGASYWVGEQHLIKNAPQWTILRMNYYAEALAIEIQQSLSKGALTGLGENRVAYVARDDLAAAAAGILTGGPKHAGAIYNATGPASISLKERAAIASEVTGHSLNGLHLSKDQLRDMLTQAGLPPDVVRAVEGIQTKFVDGAFDIVSSDVERLSGRPARTLKSILVSQFAAI